MTGSYDTKWNAKVDSQSGRMLTCEGVPLKCSRMLGRWNRSLTFSQPPPKAYNVHERSTIIMNWFYPTSKVVSSRPPSLPRWSLRERCFRMYLPLFALARGCDLEPHHARTAQPYTTVDS